MGKWTKLEEQVLSVIIRKQSRNTQCGPWIQRHCCDWCFTRTSINNNYFRWGMLTGIFLFIFLAFLIWLVVPFLKTLHFKPATCRASSVDHSSRHSCNCGKGCTGYFPCLVVRVDYESKDGQHSGYSMLHDVEFGGKCSFTPPCRWNEEVNRQAVWEWRDEIEHGSFSCFYDPSQDREYVMRAPRLNIHASVHLLLWPLLGCISSIAILVIMYRTCGCKYTCMSEPPPDITTAAQTLLETGKPTLDDFSLQDRETLVNHTLPDRA